jgi:hypothetical protein
LAAIDSRPAIEAIPLAVTGHRSFDGIEVSLVNHVEELQRKLREVNGIRKSVCQREHD